MTTFLNDAKRSISLLSCGLKIKIVYFPLLPLFHSNEKSVQLYPVPVKPSFSFQLKNENEKRFVKEKS